MTGQFPYLTRLLVAVDQFEKTEVPVTWGRALARALHLPITLIHIIDPNRVENGHQEAELIASDRMLMISKDVRLAGIEVDFDVIIGRPDEMFPKLIIQYPGATLLLARRIDQSSSGAVTLGADLEAIIQNMRSAYLVLPDKPAPERIHSIVLGYDRSELASEVLRISRIVASSLDVDVIAVEAVEPGSIPKDQFLAFKPVVTADRVHLRGRASRTLITVAQARDASLIAVGSHGAGASSQPLMGSTAEWLIQHSDRPTLIVPEAND